VVYGAKATHPGSLSPLLFFEQCQVTDEARSIGFLLRGLQVRILLGSPSIHPTRFLSNT
jgi:hypothetical protein